MVIGYSGSDLQALCEEAAMVPIRELGPKHILTIKPNQVGIIFAPSKSICLSLFHCIQRL